MIRISLCKAMSHARCVYKLCFLQNLSILSSKYFSTTSNQQSFTVSYLIKWCGLSPESALLASKQVRFENSDGADVIINFFKNQGFSESQISAMIKSCPTVLYYSSPQKTLLPKIEFLYSLGLSKDVLAKSLSGRYSLLGRSFENQIIPCFEYLKSLFNSDDKVIDVIKRRPRILSINHESHMEPNIEILRQYGVPESSIMSLVSRYYHVLWTRTDEFKNVVEEVKAMGIDPLKKTFVMAIFVKKALSKSSWENKLDVYRKWGLSEEEMLRAFKNCPQCMLHSRDKIMAAMDIFVNKLGWEASVITRAPELIGLSMKKRIAPRRLVIQMLLSKGFIKRYVPKAFKYPEKLFLQKYITPYQQALPHLLVFYEGNRDL